MKKILIYILPVLMLLPGCKDTLNRIPLDSVNSESYFQNSSQLEQYSNQFYTLFLSAENMYNEISDEIALSELSDEVRGTRLMPTDASGTQWNWTMLRHINYLLEHVDQCDDAVAREQYRGLAYFFRAYFYFRKVQYYGDVPWVDKTLGNNEAEAYAVRVSREIIVNNILDDLQQAINLLPEDNGGVYRVNKYTAYALKSRVCLFEGTFRKYHKLSYDWRGLLNQCVDASQAVIDAHVYQLYQPAGDPTPYHSLFTLGTVSGSGCKEYILARCYSSSLKVTHNVNSFTTSPTLGKPGFTKRLVYKYLLTNGKSYATRDGWKEECIGAEMQGRDPRMTQTIQAPIPGSYNYETTSTGYQLIKYVMNQSDNDYNNCDNDMPLFRLAEMYLNFAEAKAELGTLTQTDVDNSINLLRQRVGMPGLVINDIVDCPIMRSFYPNVSTDVNTNLVLEVRRERDIELVQEGFRYWDLMRWKEGKAFEQPYLGVTFAGVSKNDEDYSGFVDIDGDGEEDACVFYEDHPVIFAEDFTWLEVNKDIILHLCENGGCLLNNGTADLNGDSAKLNNGREWDEVRDYLYPIPVRERVLSKGKLTQNPGWDDELSF